VTVEAPTTCAGAKPRTRAAIAGAAAATGSASRQAGDQAVAGLRGGDSEPAPAPLLPPSPPTTPPPPPVPTGGGQCAGGSTGHGPHGHGTGLPAAVLAATLGAHASGVVWAPADSAPASVVERAGHAVNPPD